jgi:hypothetical protein
LSSGTGVPRQNVICCENGAIFSLRTLGTRHRNPTIVLKTSAPTAFPESIYKGREFRRGSKPASWFSSSSIVTMVQPAESFRNKDGTRSRHTSSVVRRSLSKPQVRPVFVVRVDNATPIILNREKSITLGTLGTLALWRFTKLTPGTGELCVGVASMRTQEFGSWRSRNGCLIRWPAAACAWRRRPSSAAVHCWI